MHPLQKIAQKFEESGRHDKAKRVYELIKVDKDSSENELEEASVSIDATVGDNPVTTIKSMFEGKLERVALIQLKEDTELTDALPMSESEYLELKNDIESEGLKVPIIVNKEYVIMDGRNRHRALIELGYLDTVVCVINTNSTFLDGLRINVIRRHLPLEVRRTLLERIREKISSKKKEAPTTKKEGGRKPKQSATIPEIAKAAGISVGQTHNLLTGGKKKSNYIVSDMTLKYNNIKDFNGGIVEDIKATEGWLRAELEGYGKGAITISIKIKYQEKE